MGFFNAIGNMMFGAIIFILILMWLNMIVVVNILTLNFTHDIMVVYGVTLGLDLIIYLFYKLK